MYKILQNLNIFARVPIVCKVAVSGGKWQVVEVSGFGA
jgi:hypothetical protein